MPRKSIKKTTKKVPKEKGVFIQTRVSTEEGRRVMALSKADDISMSAYLRRLVRRHLADLDAEKAVGKKKGEEGLH